MLTREKKKKEKKERKKESWGKKEKKNIIKHPLSVSFTFIVSTSKKKKQVLIS